MAIGRAPLSVQDILAKQKAEKEEAAKPKFMSKAQRAQIALDKRQQELALTQEKQAQERADREKLEQAAEQERRRNEASRYGGGGPSGGRYGQQSYQPQNRGPGGPGPNGRQYDPRNAPNAPKGPRGAGGPPPAGPRAGGYVPSPLSGNGRPAAVDVSSPYAQPVPTGPRNGTNSIPGPPSQDDITVTASPSRTFDSVTDGMTVGSSAAPPSDAELAIIRQRYLGAAPAFEGGPPKKPRVRKLNDKKFVFDWDASEDTAAAEVGTWRDEMASNGGKKDGGGVGTMLGGRLAGYDEGGRRKGTSAALLDNHADTFERRRAAKFGHDDRHWTEKPLTDMRDRDWRIFREDFSISARGGNIPHPMRSWAESDIPDEMLKIIDEIGYKDPSPIQRQAIPIGMKNRDLIGIAQTGSGKTASFVIPMLEYISHLPPLDEENKHLGPYALIMAPTRELAQQIESEAKRFAGPMGYNTVSIVGGKAIEEQQFNLRDGAQIVIATPGRLKDIIDRNIMVLSQCRYVVMDEADRMVDLGFEQDLTFILNSMPPDYAKPEDMEVDDTKPAVISEEPKTGWKGLRVTTLFSATMPPIVERLARQYLRKPATVIIGNAGEAVETVEQRVEFVQGDEKRKLKLQEILRTIGLPPPMIVFVNQKKTADMVVKYVSQAGRRATTLHSGKNQEQREAALQSLRDGDVEVLVATDLAGRGIDVPDVTCIINWQMASTIEKYVHRIGRTGRAGKQGVAITFLGNEDEEVMYDLKQEISKSPLSTVSSELAHHPAARQRITREMKRKRDDED